MRKISQTSSLIIIILLMLLPKIAFSATSVLIWPLNPVIETSDKATSLWLQNNDKKSVFLQIRVLKWQQVNGEETYTEQKEIVASPPVAEIQPGKKQLIRLIKNISVAANTEYAYRVLIDEIPREDANPDTTSESYGVAFQMRYSVPLFVQGDSVWTNQNFKKMRDMKKATMPALTYQLTTKEGKHWLVVQNKGQVHARLSKVFFKQGSQEQVVSPGLLGYVLPDSTMSFVMPVNLQGNSTLQATINEMTEPMTINHH